MIFNFIFMKRLLLSLFILTTISIGIFYQIENRRILISNSYPDNVTAFQMPKCKSDSLKLVGNLNTNHSSLKFEEVLKKLSSQNIKWGGLWSPINCSPKHHVAILIPYRDRENHLKQILFHMHPLLSRQELSYGIYLIEPVANITFNRGILLNAGFIESNKLSEDKWECHAYHDVDLLPEYDYAPYSCPEYPTHLSHIISSHGYKVMYQQYFGGVSIMKKEHYIKSNGYSNLFFGWGGEDDDHFDRVTRHFKIKMFTKKPYNRYKMLKHYSDTGNPPNPDRHKQLEKGPKRHSKVGLNSVKYELKSIELTPLYTKFIIYYNQTEILQQEDV